MLVSRVGFEQQQGVRRHQVLEFHYGGDYPPRGTGNLVMKPRNLRCFEKKGDNDPVDPLPNPGDNAHSGLGAVFPPGLTPNIYLEQSSNRGVRSGREMSEG